jgi:hypothetical protein
MTAEITDTIDFPTQENATSDENPTGADVQTSGLAAFGNYDEEYAAIDQRLDAAQSAQAEAVAIKPPEPPPEFVVGDVTYVLTPFAEWTFEQGEALLAILDPIMPALKPLFFGENDEPILKADGVTRDGVAENARFLATITPLLDGIRENKIHREVLALCYLPRGEEFDEAVALARVGVMGKAKIKMLRAALEGFFTSIFG